MEGCKSRKLIGQNNLFCGDWGWKCPSCVAELEGEVEGYNVALNDQHDIIEKLQADNARLRSELAGAKAALKKLDDAVEWVFGCGACWRVEHVDGKYVIDFTWRAESGERKHIRGEGKTKPAALLAAFEEHGRGEGEDRTDPRP